MNYEFEQLDPIMFLSIHPSTVLTRKPSWRCQTRAT